jgi:hypothetical protein
MNTTFTPDEARYAPVSFFTDANGPAKCPCGKPLPHSDAALSVQKRGYCDHDCESKYFRPQNKRQLFARQRIWQEEAELPLYLRADD